MDKIPITSDGKLKVEEELKSLKTIERPKIINAIAEARAHGDLSENAEYHAAKEEQGHNETRIMELEDLLSRAEVIDPSSLSGKDIKFGANVLLVDVDTDEEASYQIVGDIESDFKKKKISISSPLAKALIGKTIGDEVEVNTPGGGKSYEIIKVQKPPILDNVIDYDGNVSTNPDNEKFISTEVGGEYRSGLVAVKGSYNNTQWKDRNLTKSVTTGQGDSGDTDIIYLTGVNQSHSGFEIESKVALHEMVDLDVAVSIGDWYFDGDATGDYTEMEYNDDNQIIGQTSTEYEYALNNLKVGDMPQTAYVGGLTLKPIEGLSVQGLYRWYDNHYSDWSPDSREVEGDADRAQVWKTPSYGKLDLHLSYKLPEVAGLDMTIHGHLFNALDNVYIQDAVDNSKYNGYGDKLHLAHNAEVFLGTPRHFNLGLSVNF